MKPKIYTETRYAKITVKGEKAEVKEQFKLLRRFCDTKIEWIKVWR